MKDFNCVSMFFYNMSVTNFGALGCFAFGEETKDMITANLGVGCTANLGVGWVSTMVF